MSTAETNHPSGEINRLLTVDEVCEKLGTMIEEQMGIAVARKEDVPLVELHENFDSLAFMELQLLLEEHYGFELKLDALAQALPTTVREFSQEVVRQHERHLARSQNISAVESQSGGV